tara:strand:- start:101 stop:1585 length:1485 start_codon:yes stop_codon:yes gene_type:complete
MNELFVVLGNQLFHPKFLKSYKSSLFFLAEDYELCTFVKHHKQKIIFFLSSMRSFSEELKNSGFKVLYKKIDENDFKKNYLLKLAEAIKLKKISKIRFFEIEDKFFEKKILTFLKKEKINFEIIKTPMFLSSREDFKKYLSKSKKPFMANFYKEQRIRYDILVNKDKTPKGGKWSFDNENRKKLPKNIKLPKQLDFKETKHTSFLKKIVEKDFSKHPGDAKNFWIGTTRRDAHAVLDNFLKNKLKQFGDYEDAVDQRDNILFHSALSPFINNGLLTPSEILDQIKKYEKKVMINSYEGYLRQLIGWREFMRGIYQNYDDKMQKSNFFNHKNKMKKHWYDGTTGLDPLDHAIKNAKNYAWSHHIERLMILSNIMNLCEISPKQVYDWFMEMFMDSSDWVMSPNVYGMGLFSDGGIFATKPYICGSAYFLKMMDFKKGPWCVTMDGLYWRFIDRNKKFFLKNPRLSMMVRILEKMKPERKKEIFSAANSFIKSNTL